MDKEKMNYFDYMTLAEKEYSILLKKHPELEKLSKRELEVFSKLLSDKTQAEIAEELFITSSSVHFHCKNIYKKLGITSRMQILIRYKDL